ncbi:hypothetical protein MCNF_32190 [Mycolicibacterium confluentis]|uniref:DUF2510 domain-containing protein n=1 Tax=Mycolicibacterium confluentis TaxID=28047 RepID=A0A7I7XZV5_9MYCO|nr:DUF2510 domain-containing protein [Mycolicibacterium confluentis]BBZ34614.1 hypothetical protein MCNF_32190 [Mycolicibacterium confluentis]
MVTGPGWYPDPLGGQGARYWDGSQWDGAIQPSPPTVPHKDAEPPPTTGKSRNTWSVWIPVAAVAIAVGAVVFVLTRPTGEASQAAPPTPSTTTVASPTSPPAEVAAAAVKISMQRKLDSDPDLKELGLTVVEVILVNRSGNEFKGIATVKESDGEEHDVPVNVTSDTDNTLWETPPGAFVFAHEQPAPSPTAAITPPPPSDTLEDFKVCPSGLSGVASDDTSCAFADSVRFSWYSNPGPAVMAYSPVTHQSYMMHCSPATTTLWPDAMRCVGTNAQGTLLIVYID